jgi:hypothetical protein
MFRTKEIINFKYFLVMRTLDLNSYGVHEMAAVEMKNTDGGLGWFTAIVILAIAACYLPRTVY